MFLIQEHRKKGTWLCIVQSYRDPVTKRPKRKRIRNIGYLEDLKKQYDDPIAYFRQVAKEMTDDYNKRSGKAPIRLDLSASLPLDEENRINIGYAALSSLYHDLGIHTFFDNRQGTFNKSYRLNSIMKLMTFGDILYPGSVSHVYARRHRFFEKNDFLEADIYDFAGCLSQYRMPLCRWLHQRIRRDLALCNESVYYYTTNHYFEVDYVKWRNAKADLSLARPDPVLQMGLFVDANRIPITYELFNRNPHDVPLLNAALKRSRAEFNIGRCIVIADNSVKHHTHLSRLLDAGHGYIVNESVRSADKKTQNYVLDEQGYTDLGDRRKIKSRLITRKLYVTDENGKKRLTTITEKQVIYYDAAWARWATAIRESILLQGRDLISYPSDGSPVSYSPEFLLSGTEYDDRRQLPRGRHPLSMDHSSLMQEEIFDGYYMLYTSETDMDDLDVLNVYSDLWEIEEQFKMKDRTYQARPEVLSWANHLASSFTVNFVSLILLRLLENRTGLSHRREEIVNSLRKCDCVYLDDNVFMQVYYDDVLSTIASTLGIDLSKRYRTLGEIRTLVNSAKNDAAQEFPDDPDVEAADLLS